MQSLCAVAAFYGGGSKSPLRVSVTLFHESLVKDFGAVVFRRSLLGEFGGGAFRVRLMKCFFHESLMIESSMRIL